MKDFTGAELKVGDYIITYKNSLGDMLYGKIYYLGENKVFFFEVEVERDHEGNLNLVKLLDSWKRNRFYDRTIKIEVKE